MSSALEGLRVLELAGERTAFAGKLLADMGADVIVVEPPGGDATRRFGPFAEDRPGRERSLYWWYYNTSKRGVTLELGSPRGRELFEALICRSDVLLEGEDPGRLVELGLGWDRLHRVNEQLVMTSITPFGCSGPRSTAPATDLTLLAGAGPVWSCGYDDHGLPPVRGGGNQAFHTGAHWAVMGTLIALLARPELGRGQHVDVNLHAASNVSTENASYGYLAVGEVVQRQTGRHATALPTPPAQVQCADGRWLNTGIGLRRPAEFAALCQWLESEGLAEKFGSMDALRTAAARETIDMFAVARDPELAALVASGRDAIAFLAENLGAYAVFMGAQQRGLPMGIIYSPDEAIEDPHLVARGFPVEVYHADLGRSVVYPGAPYRFQGTPWRIASRAPRLGEHSAAVLQDAGVSPDEFARLRARGIV
jgi:crotonobetainyl-CoA:carnitine CoA-transferase CaiB-like acyl-CoA transferase